MKAASSHRLTYGLLFILAVAGVLVSLQIVYRRMYDPDMLHSVLVWQGIQEHGLGWLNEWRFTQDHWLFSLVPYQASLVQVSGGGMDAIAFSGWLIFFLAAVFSALTARELAGNLAAAIVFTLLMWVNAYGHIEGFASYPVSHNITNLFGLVTLWQLLRWAAKPSWLLGSMICLLQLIAGLSDPWLLPTFTLPMILSLVIVGLLNRHGHRHGHAWTIRAWLSLVLGLSITFVLVKTGLWGTLDFVPPMQFLIGPFSTQLANLQALMGNLGGLFSLLPPLEPAWIYWPEVRLQYALPSYLIVGGLFLFTAVRSIIWPTDVKTRLFTWVAVFSVVGICAAYVISSVAGTVSSVRFVINSLYLVTIALVVYASHHWPQLKRWHKTVIVCLGAMYLITSAVSYIRFWHSGWEQSDHAVKPLIKTLDEHGLNYGYGQYHGAKSNVVTLLTNGRITMRPVAYDQKTGQISFLHPQTAPRWYTAEDAPKDQKQFFVYLTRATTECPDFDLCREALFRDFGPAAKEIPLQKGVIFVWNHPLVNWPGAARSPAAQP